MAQVVLQDRRYSDRHKVLLIWLKRGSRRQWGWRGGEIESGVHIALFKVLTFLKRCFEGVSGRAVGRHRVKISVMDRATSGGVAQWWRWPQKVFYLINMKIKNNLFSSVPSPSSVLCHLTVLNFFFILIIHENTILCTYII